MVHYLRRQKKTWGRLELIHDISIYFSGKRYFKINTFGITSMDKEQMKHVSHDTTVQTIIITFR